MFSFLKTNKNNSMVLPDCNELYQKFILKFDKNPNHKIKTVKPDML
jgi:hypothetical protein